MSAKEYGKSMKQDQPSADASGHMNVSVGEHTGGPGVDGGHKY